MCGITGRIATSHADVGPALDAIAHRGPDDRGTWRSPPGGAAVDLGFVRLAVIDLSPAGHQPMPNEDGTIWLVFNGEAYDFADLRKELESLGHRFRSRTDSECVIHGYEQWGDGVIERLRGMFALAIWDQRRQRMLCAVDRLGIKPLFYSVWGGGFLFGSEMKALLAMGVPRDLDPDGAVGFFQYLYVPAPGTIFRHVRRLEPGHTLVWEKGAVHVERYWRLPLPDPTRDAREAPEQLRHALDDAVRSHLVSDAPLGAFLSGGLDSSTVVALMARHSSRPVRTFCMTFDEPAFDEREHAQAVARHLGTDHTEIPVKADIAEFLPRMVRHFDEPFGNPTSLLLYSLCRDARRHVTVALTGDGGDELLMGYPRYRGLQLAAAYARLPVSLRRLLARGVAPLVPESTQGRHWQRRLREFLASGSMTPPQMYEAWTSYCAPEAAARLFTGGTPLRPPEARLEALFRACGDVEPVDAVTSVDVRTFLAQNILPCSDRMSMAHGLELRVPLCDHRLAEVAAAMPAATRMPGGRLKGLMRSVVRDLLPPAVAHRSKRGFVAPMSVWLNEELAPLVRERLHPERLRREGAFDPQAIGSMVEEHRSGHRDHSLPIWSLLVFQEWAAQYQGLGR